MADQLVTLAIGDHIRLKARVANQHSAAAVPNNQVVPMREPVEGLVLSIREIGSGRPVKLATGNLDQYVIEMLYDRTFNPKFASLQNAPRGTEKPSLTRAFRQVRAALRAQAEKGELQSTSTDGFMADSPLAKLLDGWKVIKIWSRDMENLEKPEAAAE